MTDTHAVVISCDSHVGPLLQDQLRDYCPQKYLTDFDDFVRNYQKQQASLAASLGGADVTSALAQHPNDRTAGQHDVHARIRDMDKDGVTAEVMYHYSTNGQLVPFIVYLAGCLSNDPIAYELG